ncbi:uncharacterized protein LOC120627223 [Pararge aegeria]|uniref:Jg4364 protein n=2 Tax=Pararge aegeria TaxID=116150 RepID=A0A8S4RR34_9NEOP|nr:uncharacterized protein LOC120627223 [Pararge aegeria]CAH2238690.1 jg4364 [Pararge aegeria aegeria]
MITVLTFTLLLVSSAVSKPRYAELDEDEQLLFRAAYDTPSYDHDEYAEPEDLQPGKLDLLKDGLWAIKAKINELKAFNKALAANLLSTKLKVKELLINSIMMKKHHHDTVDHKKPMHNYQPQPYPTYEPQVPQYGAQQYGHDPYYGM